ncbi:uncharacterized protein LOC133171632 [Saccostrea echinata]|uniref:uncharacterized protein LOC133171632 n=1 Tax=Saccostrea echinata TaxID=191078 RepID=UPI002A7F5533|nr:uncharacterized protein LOC133171632 [Saccostrea echinata]
MRVITRVLLVFWNIGMVWTACNVSRAEMCAAQFQERYDSELLVELTSSNKNVTKSRELLCLSTVKDNNITKCYADSSNACTNQDHLAIQWNETMSDVITLCNETCTNYLEFQTCESKIQYTAYRDSKFELFCKSYEEGISCASGILKNCKFDLSFYINIITKPMPTYYNRICLTGCVNLDETMKVINNCYNFIGNIMNEDSVSQCASHNNFKNCLFAPDKVCREVTQLLKVIYSYDTLELICTTTTSTSTQPTTTTREITTLSTTRQEIAPQSTSTTEEITTQSTKMTQEITPQPVITNKMTKRGQTTEFATTKQASITTKITIPPLQEEEISTSTTSRSPTTVKKELKTQSDDSTQVTSTKADRNAGTQSSALECLDTKVLSISANSQPSTEQCLRFLTMAACLFEKETTNYKEIKSVLSIVGNKINDILRSGVLRNCTFNVQKEIVLIQELRNSTCQQLQSEQDEEPLCTGHGYGLVKCTKGGASSMRDRASEFLSFLLVLVLLVFEFSSI